MLKYTLNRRKALIRYDDLAASDFVLHSGNSLEFLISDYGNIFNNDIIYFKREDGERINYSFQYSIDTIENISGKTKISINTFYPINLDVLSAKTVEVSGETHDEYVLFKFNNQHYGITNHYTNPNFSGETKAIINNDSEIESLCVGDIFVKNSYFFYRKTEDGAEMINEKCCLFWVDINGRQHETEGFVPGYIDGLDQRYYLMFPYSEEIVFLKNNYEKCRCWVNDLRFFSYENNDLEDNSWILTLKPGAELYVRRGDIFLNLPVDETFSPYLLANDGISQYLESEAEKRIVSPIDYEKQQFIPVVLLDGKYLDVNKITFYIHLRKRDSNWDIISQEGWMDTTTNMGNNLLSYSTFSEDDIYYQRKCVSETFLRASFYDSTSRGTQKLLYTAKLYLDENRLWKEYVDKKEEISIYLPFQFICTNKYDYANKTEGFYLHLFPGNVKELEEGGAIYVRFELCHAKYGKTVQLSLPVYPNGTNADFDNRTYTSMDSSGKVSTDMKKFNEDVYVKIRIKYDESGKRYVWFFDGTNKETDAENLEINLFEPKVI